MGKREMKTWGSSRRSRFLAVFMAALFLCMQVLPAMGAIEVPDANGDAGDSLQETLQEDVTPNETVSENVLPVITEGVMTQEEIAQIRADQRKVEYLYLEKTEFTQGEDSHILISVAAGEDESFSDAQLLLREEKSGSDAELSLDKADGGNLVFSVKDLPEGIYTFQELTLAKKSATEAEEETDPADETVNLAVDECTQEAAFGVWPAAELFEDAAVEDIAPSEESIAPSEEGIAPSEETAAADETAGIADSIDTTETETGVAEETVQPVLKEETVKATDSTESVKVAKADNNGDTTVEVTTTASEQNTAQTADKVQETAAETSEENIVQVAPSTTSTDETAKLVEEALLADETLTAEAKKAANVIVVLDPGHDNTHAGARANGLLEEIMTFKVATYCKQYLEENYSNVTVYMTRNSTACPYPGTTSTDDNAARVAAAASVGANAYVSIHFNTTAASSGSSNGAMVFYPNGNYNATVSASGRVLATNILAELIKLGLNNNGVKIYNSRSGDTYPDGSLADYYGVIRRSKLYGFPGIIIEHAFLNNSRDAAFCSSEENLKRMGIADAIGIANAFTLKQGPKVEEDGKIVNDEDYKLTCELTSKEKTCDLTLKGTTKKVKGVHFHVYSSEDGMDDIEYYEGEKESNSKWTAEVPIIDHASAGEYKVFAYVVDAYGNSEKVATASFQVTGPSAGSAKVTKVNKTKLTMHINAYDVKAPSGVAKVQFRVTNLSGEQKEELIDAKKKSGCYQADSDLTKHDKHGGKYKIEVIVTDKTDIEKSVLTVNYTVDLPEPKVTVSLSAAQSKLVMKAKNTELLGKVTKVKFKVKSVEANKTKTYTKKTKSSGVYTVKAAIADFGAAGVYKITAYAYVGGKYVKVGKTKKVTVSGVSGGFLNYAADGSTKSILTISNINSDSEVASVSVKAWPKADKAEVHTYKAKLSDNAWTVKVNGKYHDDHDGKYKYEVTVTLKNGISKLLLKGVFELGKDPELYSIAGVSDVTLDQMVAYFQAHAPYPSFYSGSDAPSLRKFCKLYMDECTVEGIRTEVAFCQAMKETNFLRYGGDVNISQYNFAGLGATGGVPGNSYPSVQIGIRAQVQHLKAYATTAPLVQACVDDRFTYVTRNTAPYVEWLGIPDNPNGKGWATDTNYGSSILTMISELMSY
ncbi:MAG: GBS Bsp-like repeat-containing protein [Lachnospiraceae bacterium]|nr:GBS Bsp-like repeat-containing protein [Lachnospiraceae bacterium]